MSVMRPITTDTSDFEALRKDGVVYVDKTAYFHRLITTKGKKFYLIGLVFNSKTRRLADCAWSRDA